LFWAHKNPVDFTCWIQTNWPGRIERLRELMSELKALTLDWYLEIEKELKETL
jgi:hypothetical protein